MKKPFLIFISLYLFINSSSIALTFKSNGEVISSSGEVLEKSYAVQFQEALQSYEKGELVEDWPTVELDKSGKPKKVQGYFGEKILVEGMPLFTTKKVDRFGDIMKNLSKLNGFIDDSMLGLTMIANSNENFREGKDIDFNSLENTYENLVSIGAIGQDLSYIQDIDEYISSIEEIEVIENNPPPKQLIKNPDNGEIIDPETGLPWDGPMDNVEIFDPEEADFISIGLPIEIDPIPELPLDDIGEENLNKVLNEETISSMKNEIKNIKSDINSDFEETKSQIQDTIRANLMGSGLADTLEKLKGDLAAQKDLINDIENVAKESGFSSAQQMYNEMGLNSADLNVDNTGVGVESEGVATDPNACNNNGGAC
jgi:hypothetical protein